LAAQTLPQPGTRGKYSARSVEYNAAAGSHQSSRPQRTQCALGKVSVRQSALTEGVDRLGAGDAYKNKNRLTSGREMGIIKIQESGSGKRILPRSF